MSSSIMFINNAIKINNEMNLKQCLDLMSALGICKKQPDDNVLSYIFPTVGDLSKLDNNQLFLLAQIIDKGWKLVHYTNDDGLEISFDYETQVRKKKK